MTNATRAANIEWAKQFKDRNRCESCPFAETGRYGETTCGHDIICMESAEAIASKMGELGISRLPSVGRYV